VSGGHARHGEVCAGRAHRVALRVSGGAADLIPLAVDEQHRLRQAAPIGRRASVGDVGVIVDVPRAGGSEAVGRESPYQHVEVRRRPESRVGLGRRGPVRSAKAPSVARDQRVRRNLADGGGAACLKDRRQRCCLVRVEVGDRRLEVRRVVPVVVPLAIRMLVGRVDRSVNQRDERGQGVCIGEIRQRGQHDAAAALGLVRGQCTGHHAAPVVADPDRRLAAEVVMKLCHVCDDFFDGVSVVGRRRGRTAVAAQIRSDAAPTLGGERVHLGAPHQTDARPAVEKDHQRSAGRPALDIVRPLTRRAESVVVSLGGLQHGFSWVGGVGLRRRGHRAPVSWRVATNTAVARRAVAVL